MSLSSSPRRAHPGRRFRSALLLGTTAVALGAGLVAAPSALAADKYGPGYSIPDSHGKPGASHLGAYGKPGSLFPNARFHGYCADPALPGPAAGGHYSPITEFSSWKSKATGAKVPAANIARAAMILSDLRQPTDAQAAAADAAITSYLNPGTTYALPNGKRALQRLSYRNVSPASQRLAVQYMKLADRYAGPYKVNVHMPDSLKPGEKARVQVDVTSAVGHKISNVKLNLSGATGAEQISTGPTGTATTTITAPKTGTATVKALAKTLPAYTLRAQIPSNPHAQRLVVTGGLSSAQATAHAKVSSANSGLKVVKTAADSHKVMAGVQFEVKDSRGNVVAEGTTDRQGIWQVKGLEHGSYTVHEVRAAEGYQLAPDKRVSVGDFAATTVSVTDVKIPKKTAPQGHAVHLPGNVLPQTGA
ncbi:collagen binding domain-containing protein [Streptomyces sp. NPDC093589]|uniref:MSCRAMM family protein n=1 Tax=Streptomyces sp. NPDC093589 TaxID=3366043 RepID=UPI0037F2891A